MMCADAGLRADQARRQVGEPGFHLATRPLLPQHQSSTAILADQMERVLADIDADDGDFAIEFLGHGVLLCLRCPSPVWSTGRAGARPDHPISGSRLCIAAIAEEQSSPRDREFLQANSRPSQNTLPQAL